MSSFVEGITDCRGIKITAGSVVVIASRDGRMHERVVKHLRTVTAQHPSPPERRHEVVFESGDHAVAGRCAVVPGRTRGGAESTA